MKGQSKALELVIVLFVLVVVAWVVINLFQSLIAEQTSKLQNIQTQEEAKGKALEAVLACEQRCNNYLQTRSDKKLIEFCSERVSFDIDKNGELGYSEKSKYSDISLGGAGVCEDAIPCFAIVECNAGSKIVSATDCKNAICRYFTESLVVAYPVRNARLNEILTPGKCWKESQTFHWYSLSFPGNSNETLKC